MNERKLASINGENHEEHPRNIQARDTNVLRIQKDYITQLSEEIGGRATKMLFQEFSRAGGVAFRRSLRAWRVSCEPTSSGPLRIRSVDIREAE